MNIKNGYLRITDEEQQNKFFSGDMKDVFAEKDIIIVDKHLYNRHGQKLPFPTINSSFGGTVKPRNVEQQAAITMLQQEGIAIRVLTGCFGSGKDFLMVNQALHLIEQNKFDKLVYVRNNIQVKDTEKLGSLPGDEFSKLLPFVMPLADHIGGVEGILNMIENKKLEVQHLGFIRGRDFKKTIIYCTEAENLTVQQVQLLIGRIGEGSELWLNGDYKQTDKEVFRINNGLNTAIDKLSGHTLFGHCHLRISERSLASRLADILDE